MYADVEVIVDGAVDSVRTFDSDDAMLPVFIEAVEFNARADGLPTAVYLLWHDHEYMDDCSCAQYATDHHPAYSFNV